MSSTPARSARTGSVTGSDDGNCMGWAGQSAWGETTWCKLAKEELLKLETECARFLDMYNKRFVHG
jgi:hypothetical protein